MTLRRKTTDEERGDRDTDPNDEVTPIVHSHPLDEYSSHLTIAAHLLGYESMDHFLRPSPHTAPSPHDLRGERREEGRVMDREEKTEEEEVKIEGGREKEMEEERRLVVIEMTNEVSGEIEEDG